MNQQEVTTIKKKADCPELWPVVEENVFSAIRGLVPTFSGFEDLTSLNVRFTCADGEFIHGSRYTTRSSVPSHSGQCGGGPARINR